MQIREYQKSDQKKVKQFVLKILEEFGFVQNPLLDWDLEDPFDAYIKNNGMFYVFEKDGSIVGTVAIKKKTNEIAEIKRLYVDFDLRGKHIGEKLLDTALLFCKNNNYKKIILDTWHRFNAALHLYSKKGFIETKRLGEQIFMEKQLHG